MDWVKRLLLASVAVLIAAGETRAADLPVKAKAVEYVKICSLYGVGFYYIPGTDTCIRLGGYLRADTTFNGNGIQGTPAWSGNGGLRNRLSNYYIARAREDLKIDTRTRTEYGNVRTFFEATYSWTTGNYAGTGSATGATVYSAAAPVALQTPLTVASPAACSASTSPLSSLPVSRWARRCPSSTRPGPAIRRTSATA